MFQQTTPLTRARHRLHVGKRRIAVAITLLGIIAVPLTITRAHANEPTGSRIVTKQGCIQTGGSLLHPGIAATECIRVTRNGNYVYDVRASYSFNPSISQRCGHQVLVYWQPSTKRDTVLRVGPYICVHGILVASKTTGFTLNMALPARRDHKGMICAYFTGDNNRNQRACNFGF